MVFAISGLVMMAKILNFAAKIFKKMTQKEAVIEALNRLDGKASLNAIYRMAYSLADFSGSKDWKATIRWYLQKDTNAFRSPKRGWWELTPSQEELAIMKKRIEDLERQIDLQMSIPKETEFIEKFLKEVMNEYKRKRAEADPIRNILRHMGHEDAAAVLDAWIDEKEDEWKRALMKLAVRPTYVYERGAIHLDKKQELLLDEAKK